MPCEAERGRKDSPLPLPFGDKQTLPVPLPPALDGLPPLHLGALAMLEAHPLEERRVRLGAEYLERIKVQLAAAIWDRGTAQEVRTGFTEVEPALVPYSSREEGLI